MFSSWTFYSTMTGGAGANAGLALPATSFYGETIYLHRDVGTTTLTGLLSLMYPCIGRSGGMFLTGNGGAVTAVRSASQQGASLGTLSSLMTIYDARTPAGNGGKAGILFLQTGQNATLSTTSCYAVVWVAGTNALKIERYSAGFDASLTPTTLASSTAAPFILARPSTSGAYALRVSWHTSTGGVAINATVAEVDGDASAIAGTIVSLSATDTTALRIAPASAVAEGFGLTNTLSCFVMFASAHMQSVQSL